MDFCFIFVGLLVNFLKSGGVAWSSSQHRSLPLQGSRVWISAFPSFFAVVTATMLSWQPVNDSTTKRNAAARRGAWMKAGAAKQDGLTGRGKWNGIRETINRFQNFGYLFRNDFTSLSFNFRNGDGTGNEKSFPLSLPEGNTIYKKNFLKSC